METRKILVTIAAAAVALFLVGFMLIVVNARVNGDDCQTGNPFADDYCG